MQYRQLAHFQVSEVGLGCASYWGKKHFSEQSASQVVLSALDAGVNHFDTGGSYSGGHAEQRLGRIIQHISHHDALIISSKVGTEVGRFGRLYKDFKPDSIKQSCERSLQRLGVEKLSVLYLHGPNVEDFNDETYRVLSDLKQSGKVDLVGVNTFNPHIIQLTQQSSQFDVLMTDFNIFKPAQIETILHTRELGKAVVIAGALGGAIYSRQWRQITGIKSLWYHLRAYKNNRAQRQVANQFDFLNEHPKLNATQLALAYVLGFNCFSSALVGSTSAQHIQQLTRVTGQSLPHDYMAKIKQTQKDILTA
jgi:Predicted oxidoreductases (related to aryl-alcohol dehydrogenases)